MADSRLASLAQTLMTRLQMDQSLGVLYFNSPLLDESALKASLPQSARSVNPWQDPAGAATVSITKLVTPSPESSTTKPAGSAPAAERLAPATSASAMPTTTSRMQHTQSFAPAEPVSHDGSISKFAEKMAAQRYGSADEQSTQPTLTGSPEKLEKIKPVVDEALVCQKCGLCQGRAHVVFGDGDLDTDLMFVGEAPGREEDLSGHAFVGRAGQLLTDMIEKGLKRPRSSVYITNPIKCRPPGNRVPKPDEIGMCLPYLDQQIDIIKPKVIIALGGTAATVLTGEELGIGKLRGRWFSYRDIPVLPTYHPSYLVRQRDAEGRGNRADKAAWSDLQAVQKRLTQPE